mmetsp:Transcript_52692/g.104691  ORF Transcript_52692/g.104691 Transcript_52692/m.104691 type:complete len:105 (-) Transcript_52692:11-325(-)
MLSVDMDVEDEEEDEEDPRSIMSQYLTLIHKRLVHELKRSRKGVLEEDAWLGFARSSQTSFGSSPGAHQWFYGSSAHLSKTLMCMSVASITVAIVIVKCVGCML